MPDKGTKKKLTKVEGGEVSSAAAARETRTLRRQGRKQGQRRKNCACFRFFPGSWPSVLRSARFFCSRKPPINTTWLIVLIVADLIFAVIGNLLWKKANRLDPASEKEKFKFFVQNQLGAIIGVIAFLPLVILIFTNKDMKGKQKGIVGAVAVIALLIAGITGIDFNPPSVGAVRGADGAGRSAERRRESRFLDEIGQELSPVFGLLLHQHRQNGRNIRRHRRPGKGIEEYHRSLRSLRAQGYERKRIACGNRARG